MNLANVSRRAPGAGGNAEVDELDAIFCVDHDVFRLQIAVHYPVAVNVLQRIADPERDPQRAFGGEFSLLVEDLTQQPAVNPLHDHVDPAAAILGHHLHNAGVIQLRADLLLPMEAVEENRVALHLRMRNLDGNRATGAQICTAKDRGHAAAGGDAFNAVVIELIARMEWSHWQRGSAAKGRRRAPHQRSL